MAITAMRLDDDLTVHTAASTKAKILAALESGQDIDVDARGVTEVDVAGLQVLLAAKRSAESLGRRFALTSTMRSDLLVQGLAVAGLANAFSG